MISLRGEIPLSVSGYSNMKIMKFDENLYCLKVKVSLVFSAQGAFRHKGGEVTVGEGSHFWSLLRFN
jgi:hypothetical protein